MRDMAHTLPAWMQVVWGSLNPLESSFVRTEDGGGVKDYDPVVHIQHCPGNPESWRRSETGAKGV